MKLSYKAKSRIAAILILVLCIVSFLLVEHLVTSPKFWGWSKVMAFVLLFIMISFTLIVNWIDKKLLTKDENTVDKKLE